MYAEALAQEHQPGCIGDVASLHARFYAEHSIQLTDEAPGQQWGATIVEQRFGRSSNKAAR
jgi:hypothetical protein